MEGVIPQAKKQSSINRKELNPAQYEAVTTLEGPVLVIAGAGSGKTRTLVYRMAHLVGQGVSPENILLLTFTRKAAQEMLNRASFLLDESCRQVMGGTFHAVANLLLRRYGHHLGFQPNFTILDQSDAEGIVNLLKNSLNLTGEGKRFPKKRVIVNILSKSVNKSMSIEALLEEEYTHLHEFLNDFILIRDHYRKFKMEHGLMDYDDLLVNWMRLLKEMPEVRETLGNRFSHIMVDEYQDTNPIQAEIVRLMADSHNNVMVVGDDSQSIYSFRGADFRNIMDFPNIFHKTRVIRLEENYRSAQSILTVTNAVIDKAREKYTKTLYSRIEGGEKPLIHPARDESAQARFVAEKIVALQEEGVPLDEIAVLFRSGFHSYKLELELANRQIDFEKRGGLKLTESAHIKDVLSYLRVVANPQDHLSWNRILLQLDKVGPKTARTILSRIKEADDPLAALKEYPAGKSWQAGLLELIEMFETMQTQALSPISMFEMAMEHYHPIFERIYQDDYPRRGRDLEQLQVILAGYDSLQTFLDDTSLDPPQALGNAPESSSQGRRLILSTVHSAKGLEWDTVFVINLADGKFPSAQAVMSDELEEERRLLYVAATRAKQRLYFVYPREVMSPDRLTSRAAISPFLGEIPANLLRTSSGGRPWEVPKGEERVFEHGRPGREDGYLTKKRDIKKRNYEQMQAGIEVKHSFFGEGRIERMVGPQTVDVLFKRHGRKTLHLDYAKLEIIE